MDLIEQIDSAVGKIALACEDDTWVKRQSAEQLCMLVNALRGYKERLLELEKGA